MSINKIKPLMPRAGSRARRVLDAIARYRGPVLEADLMAAHGKDNVAPTIWRQGPYLLLVTSGLIERTKDGCWSLTERGRALMDEEDVEQERQERPPLPASNMAAPRTTPPFRPMVATSWKSRVSPREGAFDFCNIPSLHSDRAATDVANTHDDR